MAKLTRAQLGFVFVDGKWIWPDRGQKHEKPKTAKRPQTDLHAACSELRVKLRGSTSVPAVGVGREDGHDLLIVHTRFGPSWQWLGEAVPRTWMGYRVVQWPSSSAPSFIGGGNRSTIVAGSCSTITTSPR